MKNRTNGSDFLCAWEIPDIVPWCFCVRISQREWSVLGRCTGTISREADQFFGLAGADGCRAAILAYLSGKVERLSRVFAWSGAVADVSYLASASVCLGGVQ